MKKRAFIFGSYNTATEGWTLTSWKLSPPVLKSQYIDKPGGDGSWDLSTALTDGLPRYSERTLTATFELSTGDRASREQAIRKMFKQVNGQRLNLVTPDDTDYYITGRVSVVKEYSDLAHAAVTVTAICDPWKLAFAEKTHTLTAKTEQQTVNLGNSGGRAEVPTIVVQGIGVIVKLSHNDTSISLTPGTYKWPELVLMPSKITRLGYSGSGEITITYAEAVLE